MNKTFRELNTIAQTHKYIYIGIPNIIIIHN